MKKSEKAKDFAKNYADMIKKAVSELETVLNSQNHSGFSEYVTVVEFVRRYFKDQIHPAWLISAPSNIFTIGGATTLDIEPLNKKAKKLTLKVEIAK